ncbi:nephrocystin-4 isoform X2 [Coregonus clupeaformis]|uniref:nephrocystin-4 isoform X2 n=1 Tax=Coregonus clupeaformis TaxID=59861 RepID=UPI001E1C40A3|nr:nephrocystin-4 isoform X2 [Coregonus clupeaformis]
MTDDDWKGLFERGRVIPPHSQTVRQAQDSSHTHSQGFQITLKHLDGPHIQREKEEGESEGSEKREPDKYQLSVTLFDTSHQHFFGRTWKSSPQQMSGVHRAMFNEVVYLHTSLRLPSVVAVVELVALQPRADGSQHALGCGFAILHIFSSRTEPQSTKGDRRLSLYHGTPRNLLHPLMRDPTEQNKLLMPIDGAHLVCSLKPHPALAPAMHLFPQNMLVSGDENIPGVTPSPTGDSLLKPHMVKSLTCFLDRLSITLHPSLAKFESQLLQHVSTDCHNTKHSGPESSALVVIQERRLHVGVHNGWGFLERPQVVVLETTEATDWSRGHTSGGTSRQGTLTRDCSCPSQSLALRSSLELKLPSHQAVGIALQLEYVFSSPLNGDGKFSSTSTISRTAFMQCLRWGVWCPFQEWGALRAEEVKLSLKGGATPNPYGVMSYTSSSNTQSPAQVVDERDMVRFRLSSSSVQKASSSPAVSLRRSWTGKEEMAAQQRKPPSPSPGRSRRASQASPPGSPQGPGLSMSQLAATSRYPTMSHSTAVSPWQQPFSSQLYPSPLASAHQLSHVELPAASNITHLEVDLNVSPRDGLPAYQSAALADEGHLELQELPFTPVHAPIITMGTHAAPSSSSVSSRSSLAHLYSAGFPHITDPSGVVAEVLDPTEPVNFDPQREEVDPLQGNVLLLQFLAFSRIPQQGVSSDWPDSVHFTFQLYRFPPVTTQRLKLLGIDKLPKKSSETPPCVLAIINKDGTVNSGSPGHQLQFRVDGAFLQPGERRWFLRYLALHTLQVDVWDSQSLLLIGSTALGLKHMLRQGRPAVQATHELEVITTEYMGEGVPVSLHRAPTPISVFTTIKGRLHLRLGNVGCPVDQNNPNKPQYLPPLRSHIISPLDATSGFTGGSLSSKSIQQLNVRNAARAQRLVELDGDLVPLLQSHMKEGGGTPRTNTPWWGETDDVRRRKLNRMVAVRQHEGRQDGAGSEVKTKVTGRRAERAQLARDLRLMQAYRERSKAEGITHILSQAITMHHTLYATLGTAEYLEYVLRNPFNTPQTVTIYSEDPELSVITDCDEWRYFKALTKTLTPLEEDMFHLKEGTLAPQVYLRPKESVHVPLKYQTFVSDNSVAPQGPSLIPSGRSTQVPKKHLSNTVLAKSIKVTFRAEDGKPLAICQVSVEPTPHAIDQTFRFYQPELSFLKKALRLPPWERTPVGDTDAGSQISVRCSDPNVICETKMLAQGEPQDVYLKVPGSPSPHIRKFFVTVFTDKWLAVPAQIWQVYVHFLQRVDISCVTGQRTCQSLVIRGTQAIRKVRCYTSHPQELKVDPAEVFVLLPGVVQDLQLCVCPLRAGSRFCYLTVVDVEQHMLVASWLLSLTCRLPILSKAFEMCAPVGGGRGSTRKITYTNPYPTSRVLLLRSDHPDLLQFKEDRFEIGGGETYRIGLRFAPSRSPGAQEILIYVNNQEETTEETFCVKVKYT